MYVIVFFLHLPLDCGNKFTHANRHCQRHPGSILRREVADDALAENMKKVATSPEVSQWLKR